MFREKWYEWKNWREMVHTTWNPKDPGAVRIHLIPPKFQLFRFVPSVAILNGNQIIPVNESWAILLTEFIRQLNTFGDGEMPEEALEKILENTCRNVKKVYPDVDPEELLEDLETITGVFEDVARGREPEIEIGQMDIGTYAPYMTAPHRMDLMVSSMEKDGKWNCNQHCVHCYAAGQTYANAGELGTDEWKQILKRCRKAQIPQVTFTGGEPTMREDLCELIKAARWFITRLNTNGVRLTKEYCEALAEAELDNVQITFYSSDRDIHNRLTGSNYFEKTVEGIQNALAAGLSVNVNTPLCRDNKNYRETAAFLKSLGVTYVTCSGLIPTGNAAKDAQVSMRLSEAEITEVVRETAEYCAKNGMELSFTSPGWIREEAFREMGLDVPSCGAALSNMAVTPSGDVVACQSCLDHETFGNILRTDWKQIWNHPACKKYREYSRQMRQKCPLGKEVSDAEK